MANKSIWGVLMLVSPAMFCGVVKGSAESVPVLIVPVEGGYQLQCAGSVLATARGAVRVFTSLNSLHAYAVRSIAPVCGRGFALQLRVDGVSLF